jgi:hypothetical protein
MCDCNDNPVVLEGPRGISGHYILCAYNNLTGIANTISELDEDLLFECEVPANTLTSSGDELELFLYLNYNDNDPVDLNIKLSATEFYTFTISDSDPSIRFIKIKIARINATSQLWTIEQNSNTTGSFLVQTMEAHNTAFNLGTNMTFQVTAQNTASGANQLILKKAVLYKNIIQ